MTISPAPKTSPRQVSCYINVTSCHGSQLIDNRTRLSMLAYSFPRVSPRSCGTGGSDFLCTKSIYEFISIAVR